MSYESPTYQVLVQEGAFELRQYQPFSTSYVKESKLSGYSGFGYLFGYISGANKAQKKMAMTVPVINDLADDEMTMEFVIPQSVIDAGIPEPTDSIVKIKHYPEETIATIRFSGLSSQHNWLKHEQALKAWLVKKGYSIKGRPRFARYNSPYALPMLRRNEIHIPVSIK